MAEYLSTLAPHAWQLCEFKVSAEQEANRAVQVLCSPAPQSSELQEEEVRPHKSAAREEEDKVEQDISWPLRGYAAPPAAVARVVLILSRVKGSMRALKRKLTAENMLDVWQLSAFMPA